MVKKTNFQLEAVRLVETGNYPKKDGGVHTTSTDAGDVIITNEKGILSFDFPDAEVLVHFNLGSGKLAMKKYGEKAKAAPADKPGKPEPTAKPTARKPVEKKEKEEKDPVLVEQMGYNRQPEMVDANVYSNVIQCKCGNIRYVKTSDMFQVTKCKPCTRSERRRRHQKSRRDRGIRDKSNNFVASKTAVAAKPKAAPKAVPKPAPKPKAAPAPAKGKKK